MAKILPILASVLMLNTILSAQKSDYYWIMGEYGGAQTPSNDEWGSAILDFNSPDKPLLVEKQEYDLNFYVTDASICDSSGNLLFYTNGQKIYNRNHKIMENGNGIGIGDNYGKRMPQGAVILHDPAGGNRYKLLTMDEDPNGFFAYGWRLYYHTIDINESNGLGKVVEKRVLLVQDTMSYGTITAVKHANGRDWWFLIPRDKSSSYIIGELSPSGFQIDTVKLNHKPLKSGGQAVFTPDGSKYIRADQFTLADPATISIYDFDRCTGQLSNYRSDTLSAPGVKFGAGCAVSPDSRYLYVFFTEIAAQYDLTAPDIFASKKIIGLQDGFVSGNYGWKSYFLFGQLGPDGRIYVNSWATTFHWHVVDFPKRDGDECHFLQHHIQFPVYFTYEIPNLPNYRLGPLDGSACDTLGLDNHPLANFRWEQEDSLSPLQVSFTDLSSYEPSAWHWSFGDGTFSTEIDPVHTYDSAGIYTACLVVSNQFSSDTFCQILNFGVSGVETPLLAEGLSVQPNPANTSLTYALVWPQSAETRFELYDGYGKLVFTGILPAGETSETVSVEQIPSGMYFYTFSNVKSVLKKGKLVIVH